MVWIWIVGKLADSYIKVPPGSQMFMYESPCIEHNQTLITWEIIMPWILYKSCSTFSSCINM